MHSDPHSNISRFLPVDDIKKILLNPEIKTVSFDIFDTLLVRPSMVPTDIFCLLDPLFPDFPKKFTQLRSTAEGRMGKSNVTLSQIWSYISRTEGLEPEIADSMMSAELQLERQLLTPREDIREVYQYAVECGKRIIAVSDMYMSSKFLQDLLHEKGYEKVEQVYVSCEERARKDSGDLYERLLEKEGIAHASQLVHIGDNYTSDYRKALDHGITAIHYPSVWDIMLGKWSWWQKAFSVPYISDDPILRILYSFSFLFAYHAGYRPNKEARFGTLGDFSRLYLAPVLTSIALDIINDTSIQKEYSEVYFAARDGYLPMMAYQALAEKTDSIPAKYLHVSRTALSFGAFKSFFGFLDHFKPSTPYRLERFLECFVIEQPLREKVMTALSPKDKQCDLREDLLAARRALWPFKKELDAYFARQKSLAKEYYANIFKGSKRRRLVFDCGYSGSVSYGLMKLCKDVQVDKYYLWQTEENIERDLKNDTQTYCRFQSPPFFGVNLIVEECFSPLQGTHLGFAKQEGQIVTVQESISFTKKMKEDLAVMEKAVGAYLEAFSDTFQGYFCGFTFNREDIFSGVARQVFLMAPTAELQLFDNIRFPDVYTREKSESLSVKVQNFFAKSGQYPTPFSGTGFLRAENYAAFPRHQSVSQSRKLRLGIHVHLYNRHLYPELYGYLKAFPALFDLFLTVTDEKFIPIAEKIFRREGIPNLQKLTVLLVENRGRDVAPWLVDLAKYQNRYDLFCHLHGKESAQYETARSGLGADWRDYLFINLLAQEAVEDIMYLFEIDPQLGIVFPEPFEFIANIYNGAKLNLLGTMGEDKLFPGLLERMGMSGDIDMKTVFYSVGTMMWYRPKALKPLFDLNLKYEDFPEEPIGVGGTLAHAVERLPPLVALGTGYHSRFFTEYPERGRSWLKQQLEQYEMVSGSCPAPASAQIGLKGTLKIFFHKHIPILFRNSPEIHYDHPIGVRGALAIYLSKWVHRLLRA